MKLRTAEWLDFYSMYVRRNCSKNVEYIFNETTEEFDFPSFSMYLKFSEWLSFISL